MNISVAHSPCPNDTFMFYALAVGRVSSPLWKPVFSLHDVETLNQSALSGKFEITKLSFAAYLKVQDRYRLLKTGAAMGNNCGPILVSRKNLDLSTINQLRVAIPGEMTTAHLLFSLWAPKAGNKLFFPYDQIMDILAEDRADCGVIIHESRFVYQQAGLHMLLDLGDWWEKNEGLPIPLGCIAAKKTLPEEVVKDFEAALKSGIDYSLMHPEQAMGYVRKYAQEIDEKVCLDHINTFVNRFSLDMSDIGARAILRLEQRAKEVEFFL